MRSRTLLRWILLAQAMTAGTVSLVLMRYAGVDSPWLAAAAGVLAVLLVRLAITANNFAMSARFASPTPDAFRLGPGARVGLFLEEFMATMLHSSWFMAIAVERERIYPDKLHPPVLLLHGYGCNAGYWTHFARHLDAAQISHAALDLEPLLGDIDGYVPRVQRALEQLCRHSGATEAIIVAHSMGGLVARAYLRACGSARVAHVFTLGTPHHGTSLASFGLGRNALQMRRSPPPALPGEGQGLPAGAPAAADPSWLQALAAGESAHTRALFTSLYTWHDNIVSPQDSSVLEGAQNIAFGGVGHVALGRNRRVIARLLQEITKITRQ